MQWLWHLMTLTLGFPSTYRMSYAVIWRLDQRTDMDESHFAPWLVCPVEQFCDINKRMHIRNSMGEKALRSVLLSKTLYWQTRVAFCAPQSECWYTKEKTKRDCSCAENEECEHVMSHQRRKVPKCAQDLNNLNTCWYYPVSVTLICCPIWTFLELQFQSKVFQYTLYKWWHLDGCKFGLTDCNKTCQCRLPF